MATRMKQRRGTAAEWAAENPILADGELGFERDSKIVKLGDGVTAWNDLDAGVIYSVGGTMTGPLVLIAPTTANEAARKTDVDAVQTNLNATQAELDAHEALTSAHGASVTSQANSIVLRDASGRSRIGNPAVAGDMANKGYVDTADAAHVSFLHQDLRVVRSGKDAEGIFTTIQWYREDATLHMDSVLSGGTTPEYTTRTVREYAADGTTVTDTTTYTLSYDGDGDLTSEVFV